MSYTAGPGRALPGHGINIKSGSSWIQAAERKYHTPLEGFVEDNKTLLVLGLLGAAVFVLARSDFGKLRKNTGKGGGKNFRVTVYGGPGAGKFSRSYATREAAYKEKRDVDKMKFGSSKVFQKRGGKWVPA